MALPQHGYSAMKLQLILKQKQRLYKSSNSIMLICRKPGALALKLGNPNCAASVFGSMLTMKKFYRGVVNPCQKFCR